MGTFVFKWEHPASEVIVTGTFDNWAQTEKLHKKGDIFEKEVTLPSAAEKIYYKFLVDGNWVTDHTAPQEKDNLGNLNNYLTTDRIKTHTHTPAAAALMSGVTPNSTTAALAKDVPKENGSSSALPGAFPETPATEPESFSVNPIPASAGNGNPITLAPGQAVPHPSTINGNTIASGVHDDEELKAADLAKGPTYSVNPIPATAGGGNPITLAPGEPVPNPSTITGNTIASTVRTDKESYENSGGLGTAPFLPPVVTPEAERNAKGTGVLDLPSVSKGGLIPESSLAMGEGGAGNYDASPIIQSVGPGATTAALAGAVPLEKDIKGKETAAIQSVGPGATTAALAGAVPLEKTGSSVPDLVKESQEAAHFPPEASAVPEEVEEKKEVERELLSGVPLAPVTSDGTTKESHDAAKFGAVGAAAVAVGGAAFAVGAAAKGKVSEAVANAPNPSEVSKSIPIPDSIRESISNINETAKRQSVAGIPAESDAVPETVRQSISAAHESPEAAAYQVPVMEKKEVESELLREVPTDVSKGESAPSSAAGGAVATAAPVLASPAVVAAVTEEEVGRQAELPKESVVSDLSDVSPGTSEPVEKQTSPVVTTGVASGVVPATSVGAVAPPTPAKDSTAGVAATKAASGSPSGSPAAALAKEQQQKKRRSFFGKLKDKLKDL
ncbi:hypothetical protein V499_05676 [Pseudogymnoascus sp. VKM F-103]|nr:hypothetical protein V499_05676 [Pseudogymnoascus sp. VKM F-103]